MQNNSIRTANLSNDIHFIITCCQIEHSDTDTKFITEYLVKKDDAYLKNLIRLSLRHGILPLVYKVIKEISTEPNTISKDFLQVLKVQYMLISQKNMLMSAELIRVIRLLKENNIKALAFKGPVLSQMAYGDITLRQYVDIDVLTRKKDVYKIDSLLKKEGFQRFFVITPSQEKKYLQYAHDLALYNTKRSVHFEMHWAFMDEDYPMQVDLESFWEETQEIKINNYALPTFSNENLLYYLCIHGSKHLWERIEWIKDIDLLVQNYEIDWEIIIQKVKGSGFEKMLYLGLSLSALLFHTTLPKTIHNQISNYQELDLIQTFIFESWDWGNNKSSFSKTKIMLKLFPGVKEQALYLHKMILKPSFNEYWYVDLPKGMYWGYYFVRPYLLIKKYLTKDNDPQ